MIGTDHIACSEMPQQVPREVSGGLANSQRGLVCKILRRKAGERLDVRQRHDRVCWNWRMPRRDNAIQVVNAIVGGSPSERTLCAANLCVSLVRGSARRVVSDRLEQGQEDAGVAVEESREREVCQLCEGRSAEPWNISRQAESEMIVKEAIARTNNG